MRYHWIKLYLLIAILTIFTYSPEQSLYAQRIPDRFYIVNPLADTNNHAKGTSWMNSITGYANFHRFIGNDTGHIYSKFLGAVTEIARIDDRWSITLFNSIEFIVDPNNDIRFNPRAITFQEGIGVFHRGLFGSDSAWWHLGYYHRSKHDIDNSLLGTERVTIYGAFVGKMMAPYQVFGGEGMAQARCDLYMQISDNRTPDGYDDVQPLFSHLITTLGITTNWRRYMSEHIGIYAGGYAHVNLHGRTSDIIRRFESVESATLNGSVSAGILIGNQQKTNSANFRFGVRYEYLSDSELYQYPSPSRLWSIEFMVTHPLSIR